MTPSGFLKQYYNIQVVYSDPVRSTDSEIVFSDAVIKVQKYVSNAGNPCKSATTAGMSQQQKTAEEDRVQACKDDPKNKKRIEAFERARKRLKEKNVTQPGASQDVKDAINRAFNGKGSPADIAITLEWAVEKGRCTANPTAIQDYCDTWLGLDCNGLTDRYFGKSNSWEPHRYLTGATQRTQLGDVQVGDVLVWCDSSGQPFTKPPNRHIALVDTVAAFCSSLSGQKRLKSPKTKRGRTVMTAGVSHSVEYRGINCGSRIRVVESTGGLGPVESSYPVIDQWETPGKHSQTVFRVRRLHKGGSSFVRIARPNL